LSQYSIKMLVADDSQAIQLFFKQVVERSSLPIELLTADNGRECMELLEHGGVDVAFIDINMPEMSGMEAVSRARFKGNRTFVTLMSGKGSESRYEVARQIRAYEYLVKPFSAADVETIIKTYQRVRVRMKTLIVDDTKTMRKIIQRVLERSVFRFAIEEAADGEKALKLLNDNNFDLVFLDFNMPGLDGFETLLRLRASGAQCKVIMISAEPDQQRISLAMEQGAVAFLNKPFFASDIDCAIHQALGLKLPALASAARRQASAVEPQLCLPDNEGGGWNVDDAELWGLENLAKG
jgi:CheY-like chemotaxis protein